MQKTALTKKRTIINYSLKWLTIVQNYWNPRLVTLRSSLHRVERSVINCGFQRWKLLYYRTLIYCETTFVTIPKSYRFTLERNIVLYWKQWHFYLPWRRLWYYIENIGHLIYEVYIYYYNSNLIRNAGSRQIDSPLWQCGRCVCEWVYVRV